MAKAAWRPGPVYAVIGNAERHLRVEPCPVPEWAVTSRGR